MTPIRFTIALPPITKKNSQRLIMAGGRPRALPSKAFENYQNAAGIYIPCKWILLNKRLNVKAMYYLQTRRKVDLANLHSALHDVLVHYGVVEDDNINIIATTDGSEAFYDKENPRTEIEITEKE